MKSLTRRIRVGSHVSVIQDRSGVTPSPDPRGTGRVRKVRKPFYLLDQRRPGSTLLLPLLVECGFRAVIVFRRHLNDHRPRPVLARRFVEVGYLACLRSYFLDPASEPVDAGTQERLECPRRLVRKPGLALS